MVLKHTSGPVLQAALVPLNYPGAIDSKWFHLNVYSSPAFFTILIYVTLILLLVFKFNEYVVLDYETHIEPSLINITDQGFSFYIIQLFVNLSQNSLNVVDFYF